MLGFFPYINMPTRYILAASWTNKIKEMYNITSDVTISHVAIPNGIRAIITIGDVNGIRDITVAIVELGSFAIDIANTKPINIGNTTID